VRGRHIRDTSFGGVRSLAYSLPLARIPENSMQEPSSWRLVPPRLAPSAPAPEDIISAAGAR